MNTIECWRCKTDIEYDPSDPREVECPRCHIWCSPPDLVAIQAAIAVLKSLLNQLPNGPISTEREHVLTLLAVAWEGLDGNEDHSTYAYKLERAESLRWEAPELKFILERHGRTANGSRRADLHHWSVDLEKREAALFKIGWRNATPHK
jgi:hypothetical protein